MAKIKIRVRKLNNTLSIENKNPSRISGGIFYIAQSTLLMTYSFKFKINA